MTILLALLAGLIFGLGLLLSGMSNPAKVLGFLDIGGAWDPSLAFTMAGAISVAMPCFFWARHHSRTWLGLPLELPARTGVDRKLVLGSVLFGIGWGLSGICPGPALVGLGGGFLPAGVFALGLYFGIVLYSRINEPVQRPDA
ncbi:MAG: DUF6691 family protein [Azovibrio sp.]|uniref:DUF6691 family protein n=1 Tax=Azovibrio sp. TaxID=1872673 RepID=UPI003C72B2AD